MNVQALSSALQSFLPALPQTTQSKDAATATSDQTDQAVAENLATQTGNQIDPEQLAQAMEDIKQAVAGISDMARNLQFSIDEDTGHTVVKIVDPETDQVIQQIPSESLLEIAKSLANSTGLLVKQKA